MRFANRIQSKLILAFLVVVLLPLLGTGFYGNWITSHTLEQAAVDAAHHNLDQLAAEIGDILAGVGNDVLFLSQLESLNALLTTRAQQDLEELELARARVVADFLTYARTHPLTYQVRYLDETGQEIVRVDCLADGCDRRPDDLLQNKAHRYYFSEAMNLSSGQLYVSPLDLNREFGRIEVPYRPVIRLATPVFYPGPERRRAGIVILNVLAEPILATVYRASHGYEQVALANEEGYYLAHPDPNRLWGGPADLNTGEGLARDYGPLADTLLSTAQGVAYYPPRPGWQELAMLLLPPGPFMSQQHAVIFRGIAPFGDRGPRWTLLSDQPRMALFASVSNFRWTAIAILGAAALVALGMTVGFARRLTAPILALTEGARRIEQGEWGYRIQINAQDEVGQLAIAFNAMAAAQQRNLERLSALNQASQHIAARLEQQEILDTALVALERMFAPAYYRIGLHRDDPMAPLAQAEAGDPAWAAHRRSVEHQSILRAALNDGEWRTATLTSGSGPAGFFCCAPFGDGKNVQGLLEVYGTSPDLASPATGNALAALGAQVAIALDNARLYQRLAEHRTQLQALVEQLISAQEEERRMLAYDIHDGLIQRLVAARLYLTNYAAERTAEDNAELTNGLAQLAAAITEARRVIEGLRPALLDDLGLVEALRQYVQEMGAEASWQVTFEAQPGSLRVPDLVEITAFRIAQEALTNARKHAQTDRVSVRLALEDDKLSLIVRDWGAGFDPEAALSQRHQVGLTSMRERARLVGGECTIESAPGKGTTVRVWLPIDGADE